MGSGVEKQEKRRPWMRLEFSGGGGGGGGGLLVFGGVIVAAAFAVHRAHVSRKRNKQRSKDEEHEVADRNKKRSNGEISDGRDSLVEIKEYGPVTVSEQQREEWKEDGKVGGSEEIEQVIEDERRGINETHAKKRDIFIMQDVRHQEEEKQIEGQHDSNGDREPFADGADEKGDDCVEAEEENLKSCNIEEGVIHQLDKKVKVEETDINEDIQEETQTNRANGEEILVFGEKAVQIDETMVVVEKNEGEDQVSNEMVVAHFNDVEKHGSVQVEEEEAASCKIKEETNHLDDEIEPEEDVSDEVEGADAQPEQASAEDMDGFEEKVVQIDETELLVTENEMEERDCDKMAVTHVNRLQEKDQKQEKGFEANDSEEKVRDSIQVEEEKLEACNNKEEMNQLDENKEPEEHDVNHTKAQIDEVSVSDGLLVDHWNQVEQERYDHHYSRAIVASLEESEEKQDDAEELHGEVASQSNEDLNEDSISSVDGKVVQKNEVSDDQFLQIVPEKEQDEEKEAGREAVEADEEELQPNEVPSFNKDVLKEGIIADFGEAEKEHDHRESTESHDEELEPLKDDEVGEEEEGSDGSGTSSTENAEAVWPAEAIEDHEQSSPSLKLKEDDGTVEIIQKAGEMVPIARTELRDKSAPQATTRMQKFVKKVNRHRIFVLLVLVLAVVLGFLSLHQHQPLLSMIYGQLFFPSNKNVP